MRRCRLVAAMTALLLSMFTSVALATHQTAFSVDFNALWRVDLNTHDAVLVYPLDSPNDRFSCVQLTTGPTGELRCSQGGNLYAVEPGILRLIADLPTSGAAEGLTFDATGRLWYISGSSATLWLLNPDTGAVLASIPLSLEGTNPVSLAALGDRLFAFTTLLGTTLLEEIDPATGDSLSSVDVLSCGVSSPLDAFFDNSGALWSAQHEGQVVLGTECFRYNRLTISPLSCSSTWSGCVFIPQFPSFVNLAAPAATGAATDIPTLGIAELVGLAGILMVLAVWRLSKSA